MVSPIELAFAPDPLVTNPGRLRILAALAAEPEQAQEFVLLRTRTGLTDGNLSTHARRLRSAGLLRIDKSIRSGKPVTTLSITPLGRDALRAHVSNLMRALGTPPMDRAAAAEDSPEDDWVD